MTFKPTTQSHPRIKRDCQIHGMQIAFFKGYGCLFMVCGCQLKLDGKTGRWEFVEAIDLNER